MTPSVPENSNRDFLNSVLIIVHVYGLVYLYAERLFFIHCRYDVNERKLIKGKLEDMGSNPDLRALYKERTQERKINMKMTKKGGTMGFNVRGGGEYGLGIYVSK